MKAEMASDTYKSIKRESTGIYRESGSRFLAYAYPVSREEEIKPIIAALKREHFGARHHCYAFRLGLKGEPWRANDDGEPSSTAGKPIFGQILSNELSDILIVVVRYFGGVKLGVPGLIRAYRSAAADAIANAETVTKRAMVNLSVSFEFEQLNSVMKLIKDYSATINEQHYDNICKITFSVPLNDSTPLTDALKKLNISVYA